MHTCILFHHDCSLSPFFVHKDAYRAECSLHFAHKVLDAYILLTSPFSSPCQILTFHYDCMFSLLFCLLHGRCLNFFLTAACYHLFAFTTWDDHIIHVMTVCPLFVLLSSCEMCTHYHVSSRFSFCLHLVRCLHFIRSQHFHVYAYCLANLIQ